MSKTLDWVIPENIHTYIYHGWLLGFPKRRGAHDYGILSAWGKGGIYDWKSEGMGGFHRCDFWSRKCRMSSLKTMIAVQFCTL